VGGSANESKSGNTLGNINVGANETRHVNDSFEWAPDHEARALTPDISRVGEEVSLWWS
jgi:hypothetical protein